MDSGAWSWRSFRPNLAQSRHVKYPNLDWDYVRGPERGERTGGRLAPRRPCSPIRRSGWRAFRANAASRGRFLSPCFWAHGAELLVHLFFQTTWLRPPARLVCKTAKSAWAPRAGVLTELGPRAAFSRLPLL